MASWIGTYLDLYFVGKQVYQFPKRPFPDIFSINIAFTIVGLPLYIFLFLYLSNKMSSLTRVVFIITLSLFITVIEKQAEVFGLFTYSNQWKHYYSFIGYILFMLMIWKFYKWRSRLHYLMD
ncbi:CBO0543 family protein [Bacillus sp. V3B]|uniref:CBO0543 family protein n=1 Tax=Bacillus sp. V3B TaxID=2804915 RepID=UPI0027374E29|nr:CBO0543 family protein [Bacillus sp. V3B]